MKCNYLSLGAIALFRSRKAANSSRFTSFMYACCSAGYLSSKLFGRTGRFSNPPPQFGHTLSRMSFTHSVQNVHSNEQIMASVLSGGNLVPQCSQFDLIVSMRKYYFLINCPRTTSSPEELNVQKYAPLLSFEMSIVVFPEVID